MEKFHERTISDQQLYEGKIIDLHVQTVQLPNGKQSQREIVRHPGAVAILPLTTDGKLIVVEQFRKALDRTIIEIPAGKLEKGENPMDCAIRELKEETGYSSHHLQHLVSFYTSPGFADEIIHLYTAFDCKPGTNHLDEDEFVEVMLITLEEAQKLVQEQKIFDAKTILAIYYWELLLQRKRK